MNVFFCSVCFLFQPTAATTDRNRSTLSVQSRNTDRAIVCFKFSHIHNPGRHKIPTRPHWGLLNCFFFLAGSTEKPSEKPTEKCSASVVFFCGEIKRDRNRLTFRKQKRKTDRVHFPFRVIALVMAIVSLTAGYIHIWWACADFNSQSYRSTCMLHLCMTCLLYTSDAADKWIV